MDAPCSFVKLAAPDDASITTPIPFCPCAAIDPALVIETFDPTCTASPAALLIEPLCLFRRVVGSVGASIAIPAAFNAVVAMEPAFVIETFEPACTAAAPALVIDPPCSFRSVVKPVAALIVNPAPLPPVAAIDPALIIDTFEPA